MIRNWNAGDIISDLQKIYSATTDPRMDGFTTWACKQDLYRVKFAVDEMLVKTSKFSGEEEWLEELEKEKVVRILRDQ